MKNVNLKRKSKARASIITSKQNKKFAAIQNRIAKILKQVFASYATCLNRRLILNSQKKRVPILKKSAQTLKQVFASLSINQPSQNLLIFANSLKMNVIILKLENASVTTCPQLLNLNKCASS